MQLKRLHFRINFQNCSNFILSQANIPNLNLPTESFRNSTHLDLIQMGSILPRKNILSTDLMLKVDKIQYFINQMHQNSTGNGLLNIDFDVRKGLILKSNFIGQLSNNNFYRHLLILDTDDIPKAQLFLRLYYKKTRLGDLFAIRKTYKNKHFKTLNWKEKNLLETPNFDNIQCNCFQLEDLTDALLEAAQLIKKNQGNWPLIVSIFTDKTTQHQMKQIISEVRKKKNEFNFIVNLFGQFKNSINFSTGVNFFEFSSSNREKVLQFYKNYVKKIQFYYAEINIQCENGSICSQKGSQWSNTCFNRITKKIYGPHKDYESDTLLFLNGENYGQLDLILNIYLEYTTLDGRKFKSSKRISLISLDDQFQSRTMGNNNSQHQIQIHQNVWLESYPFSSQQMVWFNKNKDITSKDSIKKKHQSF